MVRDIFICTATGYVKWMLYIYIEKLRREELSKDRNILSIRYYNISEFDTLAGQNNDLSAAGQIICQKRFIVNECPQNEQFINSQGLDEIFL